MKAVVRKQQESIEKLIQHNRELMQHIQEQDAVFMKQLEDVPRLSSSDDFDIAGIS
ncbi:4-hydroxy-3-methylbut-2-enyl diphosphate reductase IspH [Salimicrobium jeotgali]|nr:4-hydroxy-3-methylbut-2-enyl diphosphate reductase IspH [Salimicrobium jeotgali]